MRRMLGGYALMPISKINILARRPGADITKGDTSRLVRMATTSSWRIVYNTAAGFKTSSRGIKQYLRNFVTRIVSNIEVQFKVDRKSGREMFRFVEIW